jgi:hypothetical protein
VADEGLVVWSEDYASEAIYELAVEGRGFLEAKVRGEPPARRPATLSAERLLFRKRPLSYDRWVETWSADAATRPPAYHITV